MSWKVNRGGNQSKLRMLEEPLCDDEYEYYTDEDEADIEDEASDELVMN